MTLYNVQPISYIKAAFSSIMEYNFGDIDLNSAVRRDHFNFIPKLARCSADEAFWLQGSSRKRILPERNQRSRETGSIERHAHFHS